VNDYNAIGAAKALQEHGARVGRDVALVGYNDISIGRYLETPLTTVRVDHAVIGREVVRLLLQVMGGEEVSSRRVGPELVVRASSELSPDRTGSAAQAWRRDRLAKSPRSS
jgi:LacI family transcriptional regulator